MSEDAAPIDFEGLKKTFGGLLVLETEDGKTFVFRKPEKLHVKRFYDLITEGSMFDAVLALEQDLLVHPSQEEFQAYVDDAPGMVMTFGLRIRGLLGEKLVREKKV